MESKNREVSTTPMTHQALFANVLQDIRQVAQDIRQAAQDILRKERQRRFNEVLQDNLREEHQLRFNEVLQDILRVAYCHSCGTKCNVAFFGYVGHHCDKSCWKVHGEGDSYEPRDKNDIGHDPETCKWCNDRLVSRANTLYHITYYRGRSETGHVWPMLHYEIPCHNECIQTQPTICIRGYNDQYKRRPITCYH